MMEDQVKNLTKMEYLQHMSVNMKDANAEITPSRFCMEYVQ